MARDITVIQDIIIEKKNERLELSEIESDSKVAIFNAWAYIVAVAIHSFEVILDLFKSDIEETLNTRVNGTPSYYVEKAYNYQDGDVPVVSSDGLTVDYAVINEENKIITRAAYEEQTISAQNNDLLLLLKVAKGEIGSLEPLSEEELNRFRAYIDSMKFAGTNITAVSKKGDILIPRFTVYHNGLQSDSTILENVEAAINDFLMNLGADSALYVSKLYDAIQAVDNVTDVYADKDAVPAQGVFSRVFDGNGVMQDEVEIDRLTYMDAGYMRESTKTGDEEDVGNFSDSLIIIAE